MSYFDLFVLPVPKKSLSRYKAFAQIGCDVWMDHGALQYVETLADDVPDGKLTSFPMSVKLKKDEVIAIGYAMYKSRAHRDQVAKKVFADPRMQFDWKTAPFDGQRMIYGGFTKLLGAETKNGVGRKLAKAATPGQASKASKAAGTAKKAAKAPVKRAAASAKVAKPAKPAKK